MLLKKVFSMLKKDQIKLLPFFIRIFYYKAMEYLIVFNKSVLPIITIITIAFVYNKLFKPDISQIASVALNVFAPIMVFYSVLNNRITLSALFKPFIFMFVLTGFLILTALAASKILKLKGDNKISLILASSMINVGNFGLPLIYFAYSEKAIPYSMIYFVIFNIPLITVAIYLTSHKKNPIAALRDMIKMPIFHGFVFAILLSEAGLSLPKSILKGFGLMNSGAIALLVFILGLQLSTVKPQVKFIGIIVVAIIIRLFLSPVFSYALTGILHIRGLEKVVSVVQTSTPSALLPLMYMIKFKRDSNLIAAIIFSTTILAGITLPVLISIL